MDIPEGLATAPGAQELRDWFGFWPSFHDAEVKRIDLKVKQSSSLFVHTWHMTKDLDDRGNYILTKHAVVEIIMNGVFDVDLQGFTNRNIILGLRVERLAKGFRLHLEDCCGFGGTIDADNLAFRTTPGNPQGLEA